MAARAAGSAGARQGWRCEPTLGRLLLAQRLVHAAAHFVAHENGWWRIWLPWLPTGLVAARCATKLDPCATNPRSILYSTSYFWLLELKLAAELSGLESCGEKLGPQSGNRFSFLNLSLRKCVVRTERSVDRTRAVPLALLTNFLPTLHSLVI